MIPPICRPRNPLWGRGTSTSYSASWSELSRNKPNSRRPCRGHSYRYREGGRDELNHSQIVTVAFLSARQAAAKGPARCWIN